MRRGLIVVFDLHFPQDWDAEHHFIVPYVFKVSLWLRYWVFATVKGRGRMWKKEDPSGYCSRPGKWWQWLWNKMIELVRIHGVLDTWRPEPLNWNRSVRKEPWVTAVLTAKQTACYWDGSAGGRACGAGERDMESPILDMVLYFAVYNADPRVWPKLSGKKLAF